MRLHLMSTDFCKCSMLLLECKDATRQASHNVSFCERAEVREPRSPTAHAATKTGYGHRVRKKPGNTVVYYERSDRADIPAVARRKIFVQGDVSNDRSLIGNDVDDRSLIGAIREYGSKISCG